MAIFAIYRFKLRTFRHLVPMIKDDEEYQKHAQYTSPNDIFESFFGRRRQTVAGIAELKKKGKGADETSEWRPHKNEIDQHRGNIILLRLQANKHKKYLTEDWQKGQVDHHPDCRVIIDNRPASQLMVVERKTTAFKDPDKVKDLLQGSFNRMMMDYGVAIEFEQLTKQETFWDAVNGIRRHFGDKVNRVQWDFNGADADPSDTSLTSQLMVWAQMFAKESSLVMTVEDDAKLKRVKTDLTRMAELCHQNRNYNLTVKFRDFGLYRYGQDIKAQYGLEEQVLDEFMAETTQLDAFEDVARMSNSLATWFDKVNILFNDYGKTTSVDGKRNKGGRA